jgi:hypothetical protein
LLRQTGRQVGFARVVDEVEEGDERLEVLATGFLVEHPVVGRGVAPPIAVVPTGLGLVEQPATTEHALGPGIPGILHEHPQHRLLAGPRRSDPHPGVRTRLSRQARAREQVERDRLVEVGGAVVGADCELGAPAMTLPVDVFVEPDQPRIGTRRLPRPDPVEGRMPLEANPGIGVGRAVEGHLGPGPGLLAIGCVCRVEPFEGLLRHRDAHLVDHVRGEDRHRAHRRGTRPNPGPRG